MNALQLLHIQQLEMMIGYTFIDKPLAFEALQCSGNLGFPQGSKRLALIGDVMLRLRLVLAWYPTNASRGALDALIQANVCNTNLAFLGRELGLDTLIIPNHSQMNGVQSSQIADSVEAVIGAVALDGNSQDVRDVMTAFGLP